MPGGLLRPGWKRFPIAIGIASKLKLTAGKAPISLPFFERDQTFLYKTKTPFFSIESK
jgi:hypothetical protein